MHTPSTEEQISRFIARHRVLLARERDAEVERTSSLLATGGPKQLEQIILSGLGVVGVNIGLGGKTLVELERPNAYHTSPIFPPHSFRPGDLARIEENASGTKKLAKAKKAPSAETKSSSSAEGVVFKVSDTRIVLAIDPSDAGSEDLDLPDRCRVVKLANSVTYDRMDKTLDQLEKLAVPSSRSGANKPPGEVTRLTQVLLGLYPPSAPTPLPALTFFDDTLNDSQKSAVRFALEAPEVACIHGPPGTGKTHTLIEIIRQLTAPPTTPDEKPKRLLVCGASNLSVDNILERLLALPPPAIGAKKLAVTRLGHPARVMARDEILAATLDAQAGRSDEAALAKDVKTELEALLGVLAGKGKGVKKPPRGAERRKMWDEVKLLRKEYRKRESGVVRTVLADAQIVLATCHSAGGRQLQNLVFDVVIIDEATQAMEAVCWIPILKAKKLILAGDPMQLPPTILSVDKHDKKKKPASAHPKQAQSALDKGKKSISAKKTPEATAAPSAPPAKPVSPVENSEATDSETLDSTDTDAADTAPPTVPPAAPKQPAREKPAKRTGLRPPRTLETTLFDRLERMYGAPIKRMLTVQYRMHAQICAFPSRALYASKLESHSSVAAHLLADLPDTHAESEEDAKEVLGTPMVFFDTAGCEYFERLDGGDEGSRCNENEAGVARVWIKQLVDAGVLPSQIAIITPYQAQVALLTSLLRPIYGPEMEIGTVDGMQGREKDAVVISLVRSNGNREVGFLKEKRRLNVAMTRAKRHLCIVGDSSTVRHGGSFLKKWLEWLEEHADVRYAGLD